MQARGRRPCLVAIAVAISIAGCNSGPHRDEPSYRNGYRRGAADAMILISTGVPPVKACQQVAEAAAAGAGSKLNHLDYEGGREARLRELGKLPR